jgi:hypothetical protein
MPTVIQHVELHPGVLIHNLLAQHEGNKTIVSSPEHQHRQLCCGQLFQQGRSCSSSGPKTHPKGHGPQGSGCGRSTRWITNELLEIKIVGDGTRVSTLQSNANQLAAGNHWNNPLQRQEADEESK